MNTDQRVQVTNDVSIKGRNGGMVSFNGVDHYDASSLFSDTVDLPTPGYIYFGAAGTLNILPVGSTTPLAYTFDTPQIVPIMVKRIYATSSDAITAYIVM